MVLDGIGLEEWMREWMVGWMDGWMALCWVRYGKAR